MWEPRRLTTLWTSTACYRDSFTFSFYHVMGTTPKTSMNTQNTYSVKYAQGMTYPQRSFRQIMLNVNQKIISLCRQDCEHTQALDNIHGTGRMAWYVPLFLLSVTFHVVLDRVNAREYFERINVWAHKAKTMEQEWEYSEARGNQLPQPHRSF
jgi:hypothetical protein